MYMYGLRFGVTARSMMAVTISVLLLAEKKNSAQFKIKMYLRKQFYHFVLTTTKSQSNNRFVR